MMIRVGDLVCQDDSLALIDNRKTMV